MGPAQEAEPEEVRPVKLTLQGEIRVTTQTARGTLTISFADVDLVLTVDAARRLADALTRQANRVDPPD